VISLELGMTTIVLEAQSYDAGGRGTIRASMPYMNRNETRECSAYVPSPERQLLVAAVGPRGFREVLLVATRLAAPFGGAAQHVDVLETQLEVPPLRGFGELRGVLLWRSTNDEKLGRGNSRSRKVTE